LSDRTQSQGLFTTRTTARKTSPASFGALSFCTQIELTAPSLGFQPQRNPQAMRFHDRGRDASAQLVCDLDGGKPSRQASEPGDVVCGPRTAFHFGPGAVFKAIITRAGSVWADATSLDDGHARIPQASLRSLRRLLHWRKGAPARRAGDRARPLTLHVQARRQLGCHPYRYPFWSLWRRLPLGIGPPKPF
jgi:hypothetical protein